METKLQILQRRKEIEQELVELLKDSDSDFGLEDVKDIIEAGKKLGYWM